MNDTGNFDKIFEEAMRQEPGFKLPDYFVKGVNEQIARKLAFKVQLKMMVQYAIILLVAVALVVLINIIVPVYFPEYLKYTVSSGLIAMLAFVVLFVMFMDKVVLGYLEMKNT